MNHDEFFLAAIDPGEANEPAVQRAVIAHRNECEDCRTLEEDYPAIVGLSRAVFRAQDERKARRRRNARRVVTTVAVFALLFVAAKATGLIRRPQPIVFQPGPTCGLDSELPERRGVAEIHSGVAGIDSGVR